MKSNREIRREAWLLMRSHWFWRLLSVGLALNIVLQCVSTLLAWAYARMGVQTWFDFARMKIAHVHSGLNVVPPSAEACWHMTGATIFQFFIVYVFMAIVAYGIAVAVLKVLRADANRLFADSFGGFSRPLELTVQLALMNVLIAIGACFFLIPGIVAQYRYRLAWYLKAENPSWGAWRCISESARIMAGHKWQAFFLDVSFVRWCFLVGFFTGINYGLANALASSPLGLACASLSGVIAVFLLLFVMCYFFTARAIFYREVRQESAE